MANQEVDVSRRDLGALLGVLGGAGLAALAGCAKDAVADSQPESLGQVKEALNGSTNIQWVDAVGALRSLNASCGAGCAYYVAILENFYPAANGGPPDGGGGIFVWSTISAADDGGTILNSGGYGTSSAGWRRIYAGAMNVRWFGARGDGATDDSGAIQEAIAAAGAGQVEFPKGTYSVNSSTSFGAGVEYRFVDGAILKPQSGVTLTISGSISAGGFRVFDTSVGTVALSAGAAGGPVNVKWFGAAGDGSTPDSKAFQAAVTAAAAGAGGGVVYVPAGTYMITATSTGSGVAITQPNITLDLAPAAVLQAITSSSPSYAIVYVGANNVTIRGGTIVGDRTTHSGTGEWGMGVWVAGASNVTIDGVKVTNCWGDGIIVMYSSSSPVSSNISIRNSVCDNNRRNGISIISADGWSIEGCRISNSNGTAPQAGIDLEPDQTTPQSYYVANGTISNCQIFGNIGSGISFVAYYGTVTEVTVADCTIHNNTMHGIQLSGGAAPADICDPAGCTEAVRNTITNNAIHHNSWAGVYLIYGADKNIVTGNVVYYNGVADVYHGIHLDGVNCCLVSGNSVTQNAKHGIFVGSPTQHNATNSNSVVANSCIRNGIAGTAAYDNIHLGAAANYNTVSGNVVRTTVGGIYDATYGIRIDDATCTGNVVCDNDTYLGGTSAEFSDAGTGTIFNNLRAIACGCNLTVTQTVPAASGGVNGALTHTNFDSVQWDTSHSVTTGTSWKFVCPSAGLYRATVMLVGQWASAPSSGVFALAVQVDRGSGPGTVGGSIVAAPSTSPYVTSVSAVCDILCTKGNAISIYLGNSSASSISLNTNWGTSYVSITRIPGT